MDRFIQWLLFFLKIQPRISYKNSIAPRPQIPLESSEPGPTYTYWDLGERSGEGQYTCVQEQQSWMEGELHRAGLPRIIPVHHRHIIMQRNERSDYLVRMSLSWFSICRIIKLVPKVNRNVFDSIVQMPDKFCRISHVNTLLDYYFEGIAKTLVKSN